TLVELIAQLEAGLDFSEGSIHYAKANDSKTEYVLQNYLEMDFENKFDMITLIWCDYGALVPKDRRKLLERVHRALKPGGLFLFDVFTPEQYAEQSEKTSWEVCENGGFWSPNPHVCLDAEYRYGEYVDMHRYVIIEGEKIRCFNIWNTCFTKETLAKEMTPFGFSAAAFFSDLTGVPYIGGSKILCAVMRKGG
ncbi:MAG TPA: methyltransferase domain-containing protein, partial [Oscillospiraceae bacterium]|nr:methyltransferase domain-containing protein [Oscillospiraceae bacterium]